MSVIKAKLQARMQAVNSLLCVGLDAAYTRIPARFQTEPHPQFAFNRWIIEQTHEVVCAYKPNTAFYEARGEQGWQELRLTMDYIRSHHPEIVTICDAKRADIGNTNSGYVQAIFDELGFDAITLHPYLGQEALQPFLERADKANIILCRTSNPGSGEFQNQMINGVPLWQVVAERVRDNWNTQDNCMLVGGATYPEEIGQIRAIVDDMPLLVPGIGTQGGDVQQTITAGKTADGFGIIVNSSRGIIFNDAPAQAALDLRNTINQYR